MKALMAAAAAVVLALATAGTARAYDVIEYWDGTGDGFADLWTLDDNGDGRGDRLVMDGNQDGVIELTVAFGASGKPSALWLDTNMDHRYDALLVPYYANGGTGAQVASLIYTDVDQNGLYERQYYDTQLDGYYEWVAVDANFDGVADTWRANMAPAGFTATDQVANQIAAEMVTSTGLVNFFHGLGLNVFFPTLPSPVF